jgi:CheY-like chemotaxis protein
MNEPYICDPVKTTFSSLLFIDDDNEYLSFYAEAISSLSLPIRIDTDEDATTALNKLNTREMQPDLIFLDLDMPIMSGQDFLRSIKATIPLSTIPVIVMSTSSETKTIQEVKSLGAMDYFVKPNSFYEIQAIFKKLLSP